MSKKWAAQVSYLGTMFHGWQRQRNASSVQQTLEEALSFVANHPVAVVCAGRTDAGVHATSQMVHFESEANRDSSNWLFGANTKLPQAVRVLDVQDVDDHFSARFSATARTYQYLIFNAPQMLPIWSQHAAHVREPLDIFAMNEAAQYLIGEYDFSSFRASGCQAKHAIREIKAIRLCQKGPFLLVEIKANAFLYHMVRITVGALLQVGKRKRDPLWIKKLLDAKQSDPSVVMMPPQGLYFVGVDYPTELLRLPPKIDVLADYIRQ